MGGVSRPPETLLHGSIRGEKWRREEVAGVGFLV